MVSKAKLEKVVNAPQNPITTSRRQRGSSNTRSLDQIMKKPTMKLPVTLMNNVPYGKTGPRTREAKRLMNQRALAPRMAPMEIIRTRFTCGVLLTSSLVGVISRRHGGRLWRTPSPDCFYHRGQIKAALLGYRQ